MLRSVSVPSTLFRRPGPLAAGLLLLLALAGAPPAYANGVTTIMNSSYTGPVPITVGLNDTLIIEGAGSVAGGGAVAIEVQAGGTLNITGGSVIGGSLAIGPAILVHAGGTVNVSGGSVSVPDNTQTIDVEGGTLNVTGGAVNGGDPAVSVSSGTVTIAGGSVSGIIGVYADGGTVTITGGSVGSIGDYALAVGGSAAVTISGGSILGIDDGVKMGGGTVAISGGSVSGEYAVDADGGTVTITGGSFSATAYGVDANGGTVSIVGCPLQLATDGTLTGKLEDGTSISTPTHGLSASNLVSSCDTTAPTTTATATAGGNPYTPGTWTNQAVTVGLTAIDLGGSGTKEIVYSATGAQTITSTTVAGGTTSFLISAEGTTTISFHADDIAGNVEQPDHTFVVKIDRTAPVVTYTGNAGSYTVDQQVNISCSAVDPQLADGEPGSGVVSNTCQNITGPAYAFSLGLNSFSATATDKAGNTGRGATRFTVQDTPGGIGHLVTLWVTDPLVVRGLNDKLAAIATAIAQGNATAKAGAVSAFISQVQAQTGKSITAAHAAILIRLASAL